MGSYLKQLLHQPRPYWVADIMNLSTETSLYGIPSTHASNTLAVWGFLSYSLRRRWLWISAIVLVLLIGFSRVYLGVHFPHDVVGGWLLGAALLYLFVRGEQRVLPWLQQQSVGLQIGIGFGASVVLILIGLFVGVVISGSPDPEAWAHFATAARSPAHYFTLGGALFGAVAGFVLMLQRAPFDTGGSWGQRGGRFILGMLGLLLLWRGLDVLFALIAADETALGYILRYIRYAATTLWATFGAPWMFLRVKLAHE